MTFSGYSVGEKSFGCDPVGEAPAILARALDECQIFVRRKLWVPPLISWPRYRLRPSFSRCRKYPMTVA